MTRVDIRAEGDSHDFRTSYSPVVVYTEICDACGIPITGKEEKTGNYCGDTCRIEASDWKTIREMTEPTEKIEALFVSHAGEDEMECGITQRGALDSCLLLNNNNQRLLD
jgi:hypothetical protein